MCEMVRRCHKHLNPPVISLSQFSAAKIPSNMPFGPSLSIAACMDASCIEPVYGCTLPDRSIYEGVHPDTPAFEGLTVGYDFENNKSYDMVILAEPRESNSDDGYT